MGYEHKNLCLYNERKMCQASRLDFSWLLFVGVKMFGFTEKSVGRMTLKNGIYYLNILKNITILRRKEDFAKRKRKYSKMTSGLKVSCG